MLGWLVRMLLLDFPHLVTGPPNEGKETDPLAYAIMFCFSPGSLSLRTNSPRPGMRFVKGVDTGGYIRCSRSSLHGYLPTAEGGMDTQTVHRVHIDAVGIFMICSGVVPYRTLESSCWVG
ncbi:hypothetical protein F4782DRAFT_497536, partial [Xylaria castorea]